MMVTNKIEVTEGKVVVPKGTKGLVKACQWGEKKDGYVVDFPQLSGIYMPKEDVVVVEERNEKSLIEEKKRKTGKQEREEEMQA